MNFDSLVLSGIADLVAGGKIFVIKHVVVIRGGVAQLVERPFCTRKVSGSTPLISTKNSFLCCKGIKNFLCSLKYL